MNSDSVNTKAGTTGQIYPAGAFFMRLKMGLWTQGRVEGIGRVCLFKEYLLQKPLYGQYREMLSSPLRLGADIFLISLKISCKSNVWDLSSTAIAIFRTVSSNSDERKETAVKISESETFPFSSLIKKYEPKGEYPVIEMEDKTVTYNGNSHKVPINPPLQLQYICTDTQQTLSELPVDAGEYFAVPVGRQDMGAKLIIQKATQEIQFSEIPCKTYGDAGFSLSATSGSGLEVGFETPDTEVVEITGNAVRILNAGTVVITALQAGDKNFLPAKTVNRTFTVEKAAQQIVSFEKIKNKYIKDTAFELSAVSSSGLPVEFETSDTELISIEGSTVTIKKAGKVSITAVQKGDGRYKFAGNTISRTFVIEKGLLAWIKILFRK